MSLKVLKKSRNEGYDLVVALGVTYLYFPRFGFKRASLYGLSNEYNVDESFMALELKEGGSKCSTWSSEISARIQRSSC